MLDQISNRKIMSESSPIHGSNKKIVNFIGFKKFTKYQDVIGDIFEWYKSNKIYKF